MSESFYQLIYVSAAADDFDEASLPDLLKQARTNNAARDITGMLLFHDRSFIQVLTGLESAVKDLFARIARDPRHLNARVLYQGVVEERSFEDWSMGFYKTNRNSHDELPGFSNVLVSGFQGGDDELDRARQVLEAFRDGRWRQAVDAH